MYKSAYKFIAEALRTTLSAGRTGIYFGGTAAYPRVECHTFIENPPQDKGDSVRVVSVIVESISIKSAADAAQMNADNLALLGDLSAADTDFKVIGTVPTQLQEIPETSDTQKILYRVLQSIDIYVQQL